MRCFIFRSLLVKPIFPFVLGVKHLFERVYAKCWCIPYYQNRRNIALIKWGQTNIIKCDKGSATRNINLELAILSIKWKVLMKNPLLKSINITRIYAILALNKLKISSILKKSRARSQKQKCDVSFFGL